MNSGNSLSDKYNEIYRATNFPATPLAPLRVDGWPANLQQALVFMARPGGRLLEIGCGGGEVLATLAPHFAQLVGIDFSIAQVERARRNLGHLSNCDVLNLSLEELPNLRLAPFDCIVWADVIEHIVDVISALKIIADLSRPGTQLVTVTPNVAVLPNRLRLLLGRAPTTSSRYRDEGFAHDPQHTVLHDTGHLHYFTFRQVETLYRLAGFVPQRRLGCATHFSRWRNLWPSLLSISVCVSGEFKGQRQSTQAYQTE
jgi:SAM-dependent methyltransferase